MTIQYLERTYCGTIHIRPEHQSTPWSHEWDDRSEDVSQVTKLSIWTVSIQVPTICGISRKIFIIYRKKKFIKYNIIWQCPYFIVIELFSISIMFYDRVQFCNLHLEQTLFTFWIHGSCIIYWHMSMNYCKHQTGQFYKRKIGFIFI